MNEASTTKQLVSTLQTPCFCVNVDVAQANCARVQKAIAAFPSRVRLRGHMKTHKSIEVAQWQVGDSSSNSRIVVSTLREAEVFADAGYSDILYGICIEPSKLDRCWALHKRIPSLTLMVDSLEHVSFLEQYCAHRIHACTPGSTRARPADEEDLVLLSARRLGVWVSVDAGYGREGALPAAAAEVCAAVHSSRRLRLAGLYCHSGNSYNCPGCPSEARAAALTHAEHEAVTVASLATELAEQGVPVAAISIGATPSLMAGAVWSDRAVHAALQLLRAQTELEMHAGNYPFLDRQQVASGSAGMEDIAVFVLARVIGVYPDRNGGEFLIDAGGCALHKDSGGLDTWGCLANDHSLVLRKMTQEVSVVGRAKGSGSEPIDFSQYTLGSHVRVLPNHSCMTAACHEQYTLVKEIPGAAGEFTVEGTIRPCKFW